MDYRMGMERRMDYRMGMERRIDHRMEMERDMDYRMGMERGIERGMDDRMGMERRIDHGMGMERGMDYRMGVERGIGRGMDDRMGMERRMDDRMGMERRMDHRMGMDTPLSYQYNGHPNRNQHRYHYRETVSTVETSFADHSAPITEQPHRNYHLPERPRLEYDNRAYEEDLPTRNIQDDSHQEEVPKKKPPQKVRRTAQVIFTRIIAGIFVLFDCGSDWYQYFEMHKNISANNSSDILNKTSMNVRFFNCTEAENIKSYYMYFSIAGSVIAMIQMINIIYQIRCEIIYRRDVKSNKQSKRMGSKFLDGKTESFYNVLLIECPQAVILLLYQNACFSSCDVFDKSKGMRKRIITVVNGSAAVLSNVWRYLTSIRCCEETSEPDEPDITTVEDDCCDDFCGCCCCCITCFEACNSCVVCCQCWCNRHEFTCPWFCCGKKFVCEQCKPSLEPHSWDCSFCCCKFTFCPLENETDKTKHCCCLVENTCCQPRTRVPVEINDPVVNPYDAFVLHKLFGGIVNAGHTMLHFLNVCHLFCLLIDTIVAVVLTYIIEHAYDILKQISDNIF